MWTDLGESDWSDPDVFELGLLEPGDWSARWIAPVESSELPPPGRRPAMLLRGEFELPDVAVIRARLYATAHGIYEAFVNGRARRRRRADPRVHRVPRPAPGPDLRHHRAAAARRNAIGAILSDGWFRGQVGLPRAHDQWGSELAFLAQVRVDFADGATAVAGTDEGGGARGRTSRRPT